MGNLKNCIVFLLCGLILFLLTGATPNQSIQTKSTETLKKETQRVIQLKGLLENAQRQLLIQKKADRVVKFYRDAGTFEKWKLSKEYILTWFIYADRWKFLAGKEDKIDLCDFMISAIHGETNGDAKVKKLEWDKTYSYGITQINDRCIKRIEAELNEKYPELKKKDIRTDVEKNIAGRYLWIKYRKDDSKSWALMSDSAWTLKWFLGQVRE